MLLVLGIEHARILAKHGMSKDDVRVELIWTDVEEYFGGIESLMDNHPDFQKLVAPEERIPQHDMDYQTSFERKKRQLGLPIYRGLWQKVK